MFKEHERLPKVQRFTAAGNLSNDFLCTDSLVTMASIVVYTCNPPAHYSIFTAHGKHFLYPNVSSFSDIVHGQSWVQTFKQLPAIISWLVHMI